MIQIDNIIEKWSLVEHLSPGIPNWHLLLRHKYFDISISGTGVHKDILKIQLYSSNIK